MRRVAWLAGAATDVCVPCGRDGTGQDGMKGMKCAVRKDEREGSGSGHAHSDMMVGGMHVRGIATITCVFVRREECGNLNYQRVSKLKYLSTGGMCERLDSVIVGKQNGIRVLYCTVFCVSIDEIEIKNKK